MSNTGLDYEVLQSEDDFQVWTPDETGACIGSGKTEKEAVIKAISNLGQTIAALAEKIG